MPDFAPAASAANDSIDEADLVHGGMLMAQALQAQGIDTVFALCGGHILPMLDACAELGMTIIDHRHEGAATLAAEGWALATGRTGMAAITAGPGFCNGLIGLADAGMWSVPLVVFAGHAPISQTGRGAVQDAPQLAIAGTVAKQCLVAMETRRIPRVSAEAVFTARSGRPGPVYLEIPQDVLAGKCAGVSGAATGYPSQLARPQAPPEQIQAALTLLQAAEKPVILCGTGAMWSGAGDAIAAFAEKAKIPITTTSVGRGVVPDSHPWCLGTLVTAGASIVSADVVLILGSAFNANLCFGGEPLFAPATKIIQVDISADAVGGDRLPEVAVIGDVRQVVEALTAQWTHTRPERDAWLAESYNLVDFLRGTWDDQIAAHTGKRIHAGAAVRELVAWARDTIGDSVTFVADGGDSLVWGLTYMYAEGPGRLLSTTTALGTLGVGLPFAIGAQVARPDDTVILFVGDGAFGFTAMEFESAVRQHLPIICVISNNHGWRDVSHEQDMWFGAGRRVASELSDCRYDIMAQAFGGHGEHVTALSELKPALDRALASGVASIINVQTDPEVLSDLLRHLGDMGLN